MFWQDYLWSRNKEPELFYSGKIKGLKNFINKNDVKKRSDVLKESVGKF